MKQLIGGGGGGVGEPGPAGSVSAAGSGTAAAPGIAFASDTNTGIYNPGADQLAISTGGTGRLFVDASGNINLGQASSALQSGGTGLTVYGASASEIKFLNSTTGSTATDGTALVTSNNDFTINNREAGFIVFGTSNTERLRITAAGLVGIGTSSPGGILDVAAGTGNVFAKFTSSNADPYLRLQNTSAAGKDWLIYNSGTGSGVAGALRLFNNTDNLSCLTIDSAGRVGIGTTSPGGQLDCYTSTYQRLLVTYPSTYVTKLQLGAFGYIQSDAGTDAYTIDAGTASSANIRFNTYTGERARIDNNGRLLVGTSTSGGRIGATFQIAASGAGYLFEQRYAESNASGADLFLTKSRGSIASPTIVNNNDNISIIRFSGYDGASYLETATIASAVDGTPGANDMPGRLVFSTTADGAASPTEQMRIKSTGIINFSNAPTYADNTTAAAAGLAVGDVYKTALGVLMIRY